MSKSVKSLVSLPHEPWEWKVYLTFQYKEVNKTVCPGLKSNFLVLKRSRQRKISSSVREDPSETLRELMVNFTSAKLYGQDSGFWEVPQVSSLFRDSLNTC